jgi:hypothetical protein
VDLCLVSPTQYRASSLSADDGTQHGTFTRGNLWINADLRMLLSIRDTKFTVIVARGGQIFPALLPAVCGPCVTINMDMSSLHLRMQNKWSATCCSRYAHSLVAKRDPKLDRPCSQQRRRYYPTIWRILERRPPPSYHVRTPTASFRLAAARGL